MCGIVGYKGKKNAAQVIISGLKSLEYRGYDSWGLALKRESHLHIIKQVGKIGEFRGSDKLPATLLGVGHTRWATHGNVTEPNAHPHISSDGKIAVVHNGIIENFQELKAELEKKGYKFTSQTDTEVIAFLIEEYMKECSLAEAVKASLFRLEGCYAIVVVSADEDLLIGARKGSPLVLGVGKDEFFLASDVPAFLDHTSNVIFLDDNEMVIINSTYQVINLETNELVQKKLQHISWNREQAKKGSYEHFMLKEIMDQSETIEKAVNQDAKKIVSITSALKKADNIFFIACGTAYHAGLTASYLFAKVAKKHIHVVLASEFPNYIDFVSEETLVLAISQSGETADVLESVKAAKKKGAKIISIINVMGSSLMRMSDEVLMINAGPEMSVLATKSFTGQLSVLAILAYSLAGKTDEVKRKLSLAAGYVSDLFNSGMLKKIENTAVKIKSKNTMFAIGRLVNYPTALEAALKIKECSYIHAEGFAGGELKHGTIALIEEGTPTLVFFANDETKKETISNAIEIKARGGYIIGVGPQDNEAFDVFFKVPDLGLISPIVNVIPAQILSYYLAVKRGCDPDKPRNLAKSVTVK